MGRLRRIFLFSPLFFSVLFLSGTSADMLILKNGNRLRGIVVEEDDAKVILQFEKEAFVQFSRGEVEKIVYDSEEEAALRVAWEEKPVTGSQILTVTPPSPVIQTPAQNLSPPPSGTKEAELLLSEGDWDVRRTQHFIIYYQDPVHGKTLSSRAEYHLEKIVDDLRVRRSHDWRRKYTVYVAKDESQWIRFLKTLGIQTELTGGFATNDQRREIFLYTLSLPYLQLAFPHELTHLVLDELETREGRAFPLWFDEGFANYEGGIIGLDEALFTEALRSGKMIPLTELLENTTYPTDVEQKKLFYTTAEKLVAFLITQYGRRRFGDLTEALLKTGDFEKAFLSAYGGKIGTIASLNEAWLRDLSE